MGCGALESGDARAAIPVRKLLVVAQPSPSSSSRRTTMADAKHRQRQPALPPGHAHEAAIDIGARIHVAGGGRDDHPEAVRTFGKFTDALYWMPDWFAAAASRRS